jgi:hypothetical protein
VASGVSAAHLRNIANGVQCPSLAVAELLVDHLDLDPDDASWLLELAVPRRRALVSPAVRKPRRERMVMTVSHGGRLRGHEAKLTSLAHVGRTQTLAAGVSQRAHSRGKGHDRRASRQPLIVELVAN